MKRNDFYSTREASEVIMCSTVYVRKLLQKKKLPDYKVGNRHYILKTAVHKLINDNIFEADQRVQKYE